MTNSIAPRRRYVSSNFGKLRYANSTIDKLKHENQLLRDETERLKEILRSVLTASGWDWEDIEACIEGEDEEALGDD